MRRPEIFHFDRKTDFENLKIQKQKLELKRLKIDTVTVNIVVVIGDNTNGFIIVDCFGGHEAITQFFFVSFVSDFLL